MNKRTKKNIQYVLDTENHFYHRVLNLEFKHSTDEYKLNSSEMRFLLEVNDFNDFLRFFILNAKFSKAGKKVVFENAENRIARYIDLLKNEEYRKSFGINTSERIQAWINYISSEEYLKKLEEIIPDMEATLLPNRAFSFFVPEVKIGKQLYFNVKKAGVSDEAQ